MIWTKQPINTSIKEINDKVVSPTDLGSFASESDLTSALNMKLNDMQDNEVSQIRFRITSETASFKAYAYTGILTRITNQYASLNVTVCASSVAALCVAGSKSNTWKFEELALKSDITALNSNLTGANFTFTLSENAAQYFTIHSQFCKIVGGIYAFSVMLEIKDSVTVPSSEIELGNVSRTPRVNSCGIASRNSDSTFKGIFNIIGNGTVYLHFNSTETKDFIYLNLCATA